MLFRSIAASPNDPITATIQYDTETLDAAPRDIEFGRYTQSIDEGLRLEVNGSSIVSSSYDVSINDRQLDSISFVASDLVVDGQFTTLPAGLGVDIALTNGHPATFSSDALPTEFGMVNFEDQQIYVCDPDGGSLVFSMSNVDITIVPSIPPPIVSVNAGVFIDLGTSVTLNPAVLAAEAEGHDARDLVFEVQSAPEHGNLTVGGDVVDEFTGAQLQDGDVVYVHTSGTVDPDGFSFMVRDPSGLGSALATFHVTVDGNNSLPVVVNAQLPTREGWSIWLESSHLWATDSDDDALQFTVMNPPLFGQFVRLDGSQVSTFTPADLSAGMLRYIHDNSENDVDRIGLTVADPRGGVVAFDLDISIFLFNEYPEFTIVDDLSVPEGGELVFDDSVYQVSDPEGDPLTLRLDTVPENGDLVFNGVILRAGTSLQEADMLGGVLAYQHDGSETTSDTFEWTILDRVEVCGTRVVEISVTLLNDAPIANDDVYALTDDGTPTGGVFDIHPRDGVRANDSNEENDWLTLTVVEPPTQGQLTMDDDHQGGFVYEHDGGDAVVTFTYRLNDGESDSEDALVTLNITATELVDEDTDAVEPEPSGEPTVDPEPQVSGDTGASASSCDATGSPTWLVALALPLALVRRRKRTR